MGLSANVMRSGYSAGQAKGLNGAVNSAVSAAGTTITSATDLAADINYVSTVAASSGVQLPWGEIGDYVLVYNGGANSLSVYPPSTAHQINQIAAGGAHILATNTSCMYFILPTTRILANMSA